MDFYRYYYFFVHSPDKRTIHSTRMSVCKWEYKLMSKSCVHDMNFFAVWFAFLFYISVKNDIKNEDFSFYITVIKFYFYLCSFKVISGIFVIFVGKRQNSMNFRSFFLFKRSNTSQNFSLSKNVSHETNSCSST